MCDQDRVDFSIVAFPRLYLIDDVRRCVIVTGNLALDQATGAAGTAVHPDHFKAAFRNHPAGVAVITADAGTGPVAMTVSSLSSVNLTPPLIVFSASTSSSSTPTLLEAPTLVVHMASVEQLPLVQLCATSGTDRFRLDTGWSRLHTGEPYYPGFPSWLRCVVRERLDAGGSTIFLVEAVEASAALREDGAPEDETPLVYHNRSWHHLSDASRLPA